MIDTGVSQLPPSCIWKNTFSELVFYGKFKAFEKHFAAFVGTSTEDRGGYFTASPSRNVYCAVDYKHIGLEKWLGSKRLRLTTKKINTLHTEIGLSDKATRSHLRSLSNVF